jgi:hypothetical protein
MENKFFDPPSGTIASYYYDWLVKNGVNRVPAAGGFNAAAGRGAGSLLPVAAAAAAVVAGQLLLL